MSVDGNKAELASSSEDASETIPYFKDGMSQPTCEIKMTEENGSVKSSTQTFFSRSTEVTSTMSGFSNIVAQHYNQIEEKGLKERTKSRIFYLRNFNNWIKSMLINEYLTKVKTETTNGRRLKVLDLGCGKGGDLLKWQKGEIGHLICMDIAEISVMQAEDRYEMLKKRAQNERHLPPVFTAEFVTADFTKDHLRDKYKDPDVQLDLTSCQFAFHYCFESLQQAECMLRNASECLRPGGYFIGTTTDAFDILRRFQDGGSNTYGNEVYKISFDNIENPVPLFGTQYNFHLEDVVDCPEFLVHFPTLVKLAEKFNLKLAAKERFEDFFQKHLEAGRQLLGKMQALETYPAFYDNPLVSNNADDYSDVDQKLHQERKNLDESGRDSRRRVKRVGTLSKSEWEAASLYVVFAFKKCGPIKRGAESDGEQSDSKKKREEGRKRGRKNDGAGLKMSSRTEAGEEPTSTT